MLIAIISKIKPSTAKEISLSFLLLYLVSHTHTHNHKKCQPHPTNSTMISMTDLHLHPYHTTLRPTETLQIATQ